MPAVAAFVAKDLKKLATFYHPDVTIYEGAGINNGWADYRDRHLGPETATVRVQGEDPKVLQALATRTADLVRRRLGATWSEGAGPMLVPRPNDEASADSALTRAERLVRDAR